MFTTHGIFSRATGQEKSIFRFENSAEAELRIDPETQIVLRIDIAFDSRSGQTHEIVDYPDWLYELMEENEANETARQAA